MRLEEAERGNIANIASEADAEARSHYPVPAGCSQNGRLRRAPNSRPFWLQRIKRRIVR